MAKLPKLKRPAGPDWSLVNQRYQNFRLRTVEAVKVIGRAVSSFMPLLVRSVGRSILAFLRQFHNVFTSPLAYWCIIVAVPAFVLFAIIYGLVSNGFTLGMFGGLIVATLLTPVYLAPFALAFGGLSFLYLNITDNAHLFFRWWAIRKAWLKDRTTSLTTNFLLCRMRLSKFSETRGIFLAMAMENSQLKLERRKLTYDDDRHVLLVGGTRGGKGVSYIIPNLIHHAGSVIVFDPAGENFEATAAYRQKVLGQKIILLDPFGVTSYPSDSWNPLLDVDFETDPQALDKCYSIAESLVEMEGRDLYWSKSAQELLAMLIAYVGLRSIPENLHLPQIYDLLQSGQLDALWRAFGLCKGLGLGTGDIVARYGDANEKREAKEFSGVIQSLRTALRFMATLTMRGNLSQGSFSMKELKNGKTSIYIVMPSGAGHTYKGWLRMLFDGAFDAMQDMTIPKPDIPTLFLMDEFPLLGRMERIKRAAGEAAKFGVKLFICTQDINQLKEIYGEAWETFVGNSGLTIMFANNDVTTQSYLSAKLGKEYYEKTSHTKGSSSGTKDSNTSRSTSTSLELRDVQRPDQIGRNASRDTEYAYILTPDMKPMLMPRTPYYKLDMIPKGLTYKPENKALRANDAAGSQNVEAAE